ncbi:alpha/beta hydrolase [Leptospira perolatii]|uniref:Alpha/beta hydrolase n=1 Tax=Leptospira perolatii TaxID=2023191 RepID=A0A2M9ZQK8_9LEPT|nr:alpha/beta hydrolase [Leptospira perolatii]PJZ70541.1 alpha/beta hydrolase [Leptospira perolatii]PJZ74377.1 alpha/beta hydrolase [Leptospira perolatii]
MRNRKLFNRLYFFIIFLFFVSSCAETLYKVGIEYEREKAGLERKVIQDSGWNWAYLEGGPDSGEKILMVHGFGGDKDNWVRLSKHLTNKYHIISVDLPGFGENIKNKEVTYRIQDQCERLDSFVQKIGWSKFHIVGNSMGGAISGTYSSIYPQKIQSLALFDSSGIRTPEKSELTKSLDNGRNNLVVNSPQEFDQLMAFVFVEPPAIPFLLKPFFVNRAVQAAEFNRKVFSEIRSSYPLQDSMPKIQARTLILWGDTDRVIHVSGAEVLRKGIKNSEKVILEKMGHVPMLERPEEVAQVYDRFLSSSHKSN